MAALDHIFERYGWDYWTYLAQPEWLIEELMEVHRAHSDNEAMRQRQQQRRPYGAVPPPPPPPPPPSGAAPSGDAAHEAMMTQARAAGLLDVVE